MEHLKGFIIENYDKLTYREIAERFNEEPKNIRKLILKMQYDGELGHKKKKVTDEDIKKAIKLNKNGIPINRISLDLGYGENTMTKAFERLNIPIKRVTRKWTSEDIEKIMELRSQGKSSSEIARIYNTASTNIKRIIESQENH